NRQKAEQLGPDASSSETPIPAPTLADPADVPPDLMPLRELPEAATGMPSASANAMDGGMVAVGGAAVSGGRVANAQAVVAGMAAEFRRCYRKGLMTDATMVGTVRVTAKIGPNGGVVSASPSGGGGLSAAVISCITQRVASAQFAPPDGGTA